MAFRWAVFFTYILRWCFSFNNKNNYVEASFVNYLFKEAKSFACFIFHTCIIILQSRRHSKTQFKESILYISSYKDASFKMNVRYTKYSSDFPEYLRNRPRELVKHCLKKISLTNSSDLSAISIVKNGVFWVKSFKNNESKRHMVSFGNDVNMPKCNCLDWESSCYPSKHFFCRLSQISCMAVGCFITDVH